MLLNFLGWLKQVAQHLGLDENVSEREVSIPPLAKLPTLYLDQKFDSWQAALDKLQLELCKNNFLNEPTGCFDHATKEAVKKFQDSKQIKVDGWVGPLTWAALLYPTLGRKIQILPGDEDYVRELQNILLSREKLRLKVDGHFGRRTEIALKKFQTHYSIEPDGICGPLSWSTLKGQRVFFDGHTSVKSSALFALEQFVMVFSILIGMYFNPMGINMDIPFLNALVTSYGLTFCVHPFLEPVFELYLARFEFPLLKFAPYVIAGFVWRPMLGFILSFIEVAT